MEAKQRSVANVYKKQKIMTATPEELTLMLYNGCIKRIKLAINGILQKDISCSHNNILKAQAIVRELKTTLNMDYEISKEMAEVYDYILTMLVQGNIKKEVEYLENASVLVEEFRDTWFELMKMKRDGKISNAI